MDVIRRAGHRRRTVLPRCKLFASFDSFLFGIIKVVEFCEHASQHGKIVIISALGGTYKREGFNSILDLVPKAEKIK